MPTWQAWGLSLHLVGFVNGFVSLRHQRLIESTYANLLALVGQEQEVDTAHRL